MFIGTYYHTIEEKGRVSLPKKFRDESSEWIITRGLDGGLFLFFKNTFIAEMEKLQTRTFTKQANRDFVRLMTNEAQEVEVDQNGRIQIPEYLRAAAQLTKDVVIIGSFQRVEIWDVLKYHTYIDQITQRAEEIAEQVTHD
ncbi:division/cell wall cluster transcriptional repressor MraZ [soil metagenome]